MQPYRCARDIYNKSGILLDANENPVPRKMDRTRGLNRYPDPRSKEVKEAFAKFRELPNSDGLFFGVGSDEAIDIAIRCFCIPGRDAIIICPPTYGMYSVCAGINDVKVIRVPLDVDFQLCVDKVCASIDKCTLDAMEVRDGTDHVSVGRGTVKIVFLCSPGNPTGSLLRRADIINILEYPGFTGIVIVDEAYIDFTHDEMTNDTHSMIPLLADYPNLIIIQTLSKSFALAGIRFGVSISSPAIAQIFNNIKAPYNISSLTASAALEALEAPGVLEMRNGVTAICSERGRMITFLAGMRGVGRIRGSNDANFVLFEVMNVGSAIPGDTSAIAQNSPCNSTAYAVYKRLAEHFSIITRFRGEEDGCRGCIRVSIGTRAENDAFLGALSECLE